MDREDKLIEGYKVIAARRNSQNTLVWQTAALTLTAQSFLYTIALGGQTSRGGRIIALVLSIFSALATFQVLAKHRYLEMNDSKRLQELEDQFWPSNFGNPPHERLDTDGENFWVRIRSYEMWQCLQVVFLVMSIGLLFAIGACCDNWLVRKDVKASREAEKLSANLTFDLPKTNFHTEILASPNTGLAMSNTTATVTQKITNAGSNP